MDKVEASKFCDEYCADVPAFMQTFTRKWSSLYEDISLNHHQAGVLVFIDQKKSCKMSELAIELNLSPGAITQIVDPLVLQGFLERDRDESDRRVVLVRVTDGAKDVIKKIMTRRKTMLIEIFSSLSRDEALTLITLIKKLEFTLRGIDIAEIIEYANAGASLKLGMQEDEILVD